MYFQNQGVRSNKRLLAMLLAVLMVFTAFPLLQVGAAEDPLPDRQFTSFALQSSYGSDTYTLGYSDADPTDAVWTETDDGNYTHEIALKRASGYPITMHLDADLADGYHLLSSDRLTFDAAGSEETITVSDGSNTTSYTLTLRLSTDNKPVLMEKVGVKIGDKTYAATPVNDQYIFVKPRAISPMSLFTTDVYYRIDFNGDVTYSDFLNKGKWDFALMGDNKATGVVMDMLGNKVVNGGSIPSAIEYYSDEIFLMVGNGNAFDYDAVKYFLDFTGLDHGGGGGAGGAEDFYTNIWLEETAPSDPDEPLNEYAHEETRSSGVVYYEAEFPFGHNASKLHYIEIGGGATYQDKYWELTGVWEGHNPTGDSILPALSGSPDGKTYRFDANQLYTLQYSPYDDPNTKLLKKIAVKIVTAPGDEVGFSAQGVSRETDDRYDDSTFYKIHRLDDRLVKEGYHDGFIAGQEYDLAKTRLYYTTPGGCVVTVDGKTVQSGDVFDFSKGYVTFTATSPDKSKSVDHYVTVVQIQDEKQLFVFTGNNTTRSVYLRAESNNNYYYDIFFANLGKEDITGLKATITKGGEYVEFDSYWSLGKDAYLEGFRQMPSTDVVSYTERRFMDNIGKVRLVLKDGIAGGQNYDIAVKFEADGKIIDPGNPDPIDPPENPDPDPDPDPDPGSKSDRSSRSSGGGSSADSAFVRRSPWDNIGRKITNAINRKKAANPDMETPTVTIPITDTYQISASVLKEIRSAALKAGGRAIIRVDCYEGGKLQYSFVIDSAKIPADIKDGMELYLFLNSTVVQSIREKVAQRYGTDQFEILRFSQRKAFAVEMGVNVSLAGLDTDNLYFYSCNPSTGVCTPLDDVAYITAKDGMLRITTTVSGTLVVTDTPLD